VHQGSLAARLELPGAFQKGEVRRLFEEAPGFVAVLKGSRRTFALANPGFIELVGGRNLIGRSLPEAFPDLEGQALLSLIDKVWETGLSITRRGEPLILQRELGHPPEVRYVDFVCQTITGQDGSITGVFLQGHDATEQKRVEEQMRLALRGGKVAAWERDLTTNHVRWSENATEILGITSGPFQEFAERIHPEDRVVHRAALEALMTCGTPYTIEVRFVRSCGTTIWIEHRGEIHAGLDGRRSLVGVTADITKRKVAELEAQEKSCLLEATLENMDQGLMVVDGSQRVLLCNQRAAALLDLPSELMARRPHLEEIKQYQLQMGEFLDSGEGNSKQVQMQGFAFDPCQYECVRPNGTVLEVRTVAGEDGRAVRTYTDITARRLAEAELRENEARFRKELEAAAAVQRSLLPPDGSIGPVSYTGLLRSCSLIGGDTYNVIDLHDGKLVFFQVDICGHGAAAALASVAAHHMVT
jgi:PAS domain S-box-containing protein